MREVVGREIRFLRAPVVETGQVRWMLGKVRRSGVSAAVRAVAASGVVVKSLKKRGVVVRGDGTSLIDVSAG